MAVERMMLLLLLKTHTAATATNIHLERYLTDTLVDVETGGRYVLGDRLHYPTFPRRTAITAVQSKRVLLQHAGPRSSFLRSIGPMVSSKPDERFLAPIFDHINPSNVGHTGNGKH
uniref:Putative secreted protein n=1 Tax=Anopheles marajoara TaxID=58244 RepID=A0A2M4C7K5_9DIPT